MPTATAAPIAVQVTFDGETCAYAGPSTVPAGAVLVWTFANTPLPIDDYGSVLVVAPVDEGTTWEQILAYLAVEPRASIVPDWLILPDVGQAEIKGLFDTAAEGELLRNALRSGSFRVSASDLMPARVATAFAKGTLDYLTWGPMGMSATLGAIQETWRTPR